MNYHLGFILLTLVFVQPVCAQGPGDPTPAVALQKAKAEFDTGFVYRTVGSPGVAMEILDDVSSGKKEQDIPPISLAMINAKYQDAKSNFRGHFRDGFKQLTKALNKAFDKDGINNDTYQQLKTWLASNSSPAPPVAATADQPKAVEQKYAGFRWFPDAELTLVADRLLSALDSRFQGTPTSDASPAEDGDATDEVDDKKQEETEPDEKSIEESGPYRLFTQTKDEAIGALSTYWLFRQDISLLPSDTSGDLQRGSRKQMALEGLYLQLQERRLQARINAAKKRFNESSRNQTVQSQIQEQRDLAEDELQKTGFEAYLSLAILGASHDNATRFSGNGGGELRTKLAVANRVHSMIRSGKQPDGYIESFIPNRNPAEVFGDAASAVISAIEKEKSASSDRQLELSSIRQISAEHAAQRMAFRQPLDQLCGLRFKSSTVEKVPNKPMILPVDGVKTAINPSNPQHRRALLDLIDSTIDAEIRSQLDELKKKQSLLTNATQGGAFRATPAGIDPSDLLLGKYTVRSFGQLGSSALDVIIAIEQANDAMQRVQDELEKIEAEKLFAEDLGRLSEEDLNAQRSNLRSWAMKESKSIFDETAASYMTVTTGTQGTNVSVNPNELALGSVRDQRLSDQTDRDISSMEIQKNREERERELGLKKTIDGLKREFRNQGSQLRAAMLRLNQARNIYAGERARLSDLMEEWATAKDLVSEGFADFTAQCVKRRKSRIEADMALDDAITACYLASKAMQYVWVERYSNPVTVMGTGTDVTLSSPSFRPFTNPESILGARNANECRDFLFALYDWHKTLASGLRGSPRGNEFRFTRMISLRRSLLDLDEFVVRPTDVSDLGRSTTVAERRTQRIAEFRKWIERRLFYKRGEAFAFAFDFATEIDSDRMFPQDEWNQKILRIGVNFIGDGLPQASPSISLTQSGTVSMRRFPPAFDNIERLSLSGYGLNEFSDVFNRPAEQRTYDKISEVQIHASRRDFLEAPERTMSSALVDMSVAADQWTFLMNFNDPSNRTVTGEPFPIGKLTDIEFIFMYSFNHPNEELTAQMQHAIDRLSPSTN